MSVLLASTIVLLMLPALPARQVVLVGTVATDSGVPVANTRVTVAGAQSDATDPKGRFRIALSKDVSEGERVLITVEKPGWVILHPLDGEWNLPNSKLQTIQTLRVVIVPKGSKALWTSDRIERYIARISDQITRLKKEGDKSRPVDFSSYFVQLAEKYGSTPEQVRQEFDNWAGLVAGSSDYRKLGLAEFYKSNFASASENFDKAALKDQERAKDLSRRAEQAELDAYENWKLSGNSLSSLYSFRRALDKYAEARRIVQGGRYPRLLAEIETLIGNAQMELGVRVAPEEASRLLVGSTSSYERALQIISRERYPAQWAETQASLGTVLQVEGTRVDPTKGFQLLGDAVRAYSRALEVFNQEQHPKEWATTQNNLAKLFRSKVCVRLGRRVPNRWIRPHRPIGVR